MTDLRERLAALTPAQREQLLRTVRARSGALPRLPDGPAPLSAEQRRIWFLLHLAPDEPLYTIPRGFLLRGAVEVDALRGALAELVARHETLRTAFRESAGEPVQEVLPPGGWEAEVVELRGDPWAGPEASYQAQSFARGAFDLAAGETFRARVVRVADDEVRLLVGVHHLAADGASLAILLEELGELYTARVEGRSSSLAPPEARFRDWAAWQGRRGGGAEAEAYWREALAGAPQVLELPTDRPRPPVQGWEGAKHRLDCPPGLASSLAAFARAERTTPFAVLTTAWALVLARLAGTGELLLGTVAANRPRPELRRAVGFFANTLPLRVRIDADPPVAELVRRVQATTADAVAHGGLPFDRIVELAGVARDLGRPPLVQAVVSFVDSPGPALELPAVEVEPLPLDAGTALFDLTLAVERAGDELTGILQYPTALYDAGSAERMGAQLVRALGWIVASPAAPVSALPLATEEERAAAAALGDGGPPLRRAEPVHAAFERNATAHPDAVAVVHGERRVGYRELDRRANAVAHALAGHGIGPESRVGVRMERTPELLAVLLGVLKAGATYVPLDPAHPPARHAASLLASGAKVAIVDAASARDAIPPEVAVLTAGSLDGTADAPPRVEIDPESLAYVLFTSGSTGGPKGVEVPHRAAAAVAAWTAREVADDLGGVLGAASVTFDVSVGEIFGTLGGGGTLVLVENALALLPHHPLHAAAMTPTAAAELVADGRFPAHVRTVLLGGEPVPPSLVDALHALPGERRVLNLYGPTEDTVYSTCAELWPGEPVRLGRPVAGGRVAVLDPRLRHAGPEEPGEIWTAGAGVARGYAGRPALTADRFRPDPHGPPGSRTFRTLDRGRWRADGTLEFLGRGDSQVKVRGYRIELEEVEQALAAHPAVAMAAVAPYGEGTERRLAAHLVAAGEGRPTSAELRAWLRERLPEYMVPAVFLWTASLPRTGSGKLDRRALPDPAPAAAVAVEHVGPRSPLEARIAAVWSAVLGVERVEVHDDFFDLGGQSILATRLVARLREEVGAELSLRDLLQAPTVEGVARLLAADREPAVALPLVALQTFGERPPLFLVHSAGGHVACYRGLAVHLAPDQPVYALQPQGVDDGAAPLRTVEALAERYRAAIRRFRPAGPYRVGGWSFGGVVAWEIARRLAEEGAEVDLLALLDTAPLLPGAVRSDARETAEVIWHTVAGLAGWAHASRVDVATLRGLSPEDAALAMIRAMDVPLLLPEARLGEVLALTGVRAANLEAQAAYAPPPYPGHLTYLRTAGSQFAEGLVEGLEYWSSRAEGGATVHRVTGSHGSILQEPHVQGVAAALLAAG